MNIRDQWLLPAGIEEVLPPQSWRLEQVRRQVLDLYRCWGYELVIPPFIEYLESLLTGAGNDLDLQTFKLTDQLTGRMMGVRSDMTPKAARIDAHPMKSDFPSRLCYLGTVLHTRPDGFAGSRSPMQVGAELFGHAGVDSDIEILSLVLETLSLTGVKDVHMDLGHVGIFRGLARDADLDRDQEIALFEALQRKAVSDNDALLGQTSAGSEQRQRLARLADLNGDEGMLAEARSVLSGAGDAVIAALDNLCEISEAMHRRMPDNRFYYDLAELRGYNFHTGMVFAVFVPGCGQEVARGGRYESIGEVFGRARPATGFSTDLKILMDLSQRDFGPPGSAILAPADVDPALTAAVQQLRQAGERVVCALPGQTGSAADMGCERTLVRGNGGWVVKPA